MIQEHQTPVTQEPLRTWEPESKSLDAPPANTTSRPFNPLWPELSRQTEPADQDPDRPKDNQATNTSSPIDPDLFDVP